MSTFNKSFLILALGLITVVGAAGAANARWGGPGGCWGYGRGAGQEISEEAQKLLHSAHDKLAPLFLELRAKHDEFTAKAHGGADSKVLDALSKEIHRLQTQVTEGRLALQQQLAAAGVSLRDAAGGCVMGGPGMGRGMGRGMMGGGPGRGMMRGQGSCPMWQ